MMKDVFIWRESVYKNHFKCNKCGHVVANEHGYPQDDTLFAPSHDLLFCGKCKNPVCKIQKMNTNLPDGLHGNIDDYIER